MAFIREHYVSIAANLKGDFAGGLTVAVPGVAGSIIFGLMATSSLGPDYAGVGILAGLYATVFGGFCAAVFGGAPGVISGSRPTSALVLSGVMTQLLSLTAVQAGSTPTPTMVLTLAFCVVSLSGIIQLLFGLLRFGSVVKYISYPVVAGILNGTAVLMLIKAFWGCLGVAKQPLGDLWGDLGQIQPLITVIALSSTLLWLQGEKYVRGVPGGILSIVGGTILYHILLALGFGASIGPTLIPVPSGIPQPSYLLGFSQALSTITHPQVWPVLLSGALSIAILGSIDSLLSMLAAQNLGGERGNANLELIGQGIGNMVNGIFGALPSAGSAGRVISNYRAGGRTRLSGVFCALITLLIVLAGTRAIGFIPQAVIAGVTAVAVFLVVDRWSLQLLRQTFSRGVDNRRELVLNLSIILVVMAIVVWFDIMMAVVVGIAISGVLFLVQMSKSIVRNTYSGSKIRSRRHRTIQILDTLRTHGDQIAILELEGPVFFGATDSLVRTIDELVSQGARYVILDLKRTKGADISGARVLVQTYAQMQQRGVMLVFSYLSPDTRLSSFLVDLGLLQNISNEHMFVDMDQALEYCENLLLGAMASDQQRDLMAIIQAIFGLDADDREALESLDECLTKETFKAGELLCRQGDPGDTMYIITEGMIEVSIPLPNTTHNKRLATMGSGTILGEMALLDQGNRTADVKVLEDLTCYRISIEELDYLKRERPRVAVLILDTVSKIVVARSRQLIETVAELEN